MRTGAGSHILGLLALVVGLQMSWVVLMEGASTDQHSAAFLRPLEVIADQAAGVKEQLLAPVISAAENMVGTMEQVVGNQVVPETSHPLQSTMPLPPETSNIVATSSTPASTSTPPPTIAIVSTTPGPSAPTNGMCIDATSGLILTTSAITCTNATGYCVSTDTNSTCTSQFGSSCVPINTNNGLCGPFLPATLL
ncbi:hypothetical protein COCOBI_06-6270 [Coccomyxa sp. Obi]|nr:hypothetical protein COCOBI_06-6270 [Coccomyxa sp. Obi]